MKTLVCRKFGSMKMKIGQVKAICDECKATIICEKKLRSYKPKLCEECGLEQAVDGMLERKISTKKVMERFCYGN